MKPQLADDELLIVRTFDAPAATLFALWTNPKHFARWMGPGGLDCPDIMIDLRVGGAYRAMIRSADHGDNWFGGVYREIEPDRRLVFTFTWHNSGPSAEIETLVTITFEERDGRTRQTFHQSPFRNAERRDAHRRGWNQIFDKLAAYAASLAQEHKP